MTESISNLGLPGFTKKQMDLKSIMVGNKADGLAEAINLKMVIGRRTMLSRRRVSAFGTRPQQLSAGLEPRRTWNINFELHGFAIQRTGIIRQTDLKRVGD